ncbi:serine/threonine-protein kinase [Saccharothrix sp. NRRL B-16314]|uniref:serine/threonine-protein kinase n=1 Tax=Saccharothrix sp. NRRL B-16314 TaxID=1463825 RepID=UPI00068BF849|nr:serine/threonine-protein kinase [Saccharothrix sp. NRRL B-16314]
MAESGGTVGGRYTLVEQIGSGAMGVVWLARDALLDRPVAVKELRPDLAFEEVQVVGARAMREARNAARLQHPNAVAVFDVVVEDDRPWLVMEYVPARTLGALLTERGTVDPAEAARIGGRVASALAAAHAAGIVHRDVKPSNVLIGEDGTVKLTDFGISRAAGDGTLTGSGMITGTPAYLAPEVARGEQPDTSSDVFSLGATLYAATEGQSPHGVSDNSFGLLYRAALGKVEPPTRSGPLTGVLMRMLATDPTTRPTAAEAIGLLAEPPAEPESPDQSEGQSEGQSHDQSHAEPAAKPPARARAKWRAKPRAGSDDPAAASPAEPPAESPAASPAEPRPKWRAKSRAGSDDPDTAPPAASPAQPCPKSPAERRAKWPAEPAAASPGTVPAEVPAEKSTGQAGGQRGGQTGEGAADPSPEHERRRWLVPVTVAAVLVLLAVVGGAAAYLWPRARNGPGTPVTTTAPAYTTEDAVAMVRGHYESLPEDPQTAYRNLATHYRPTFEDYTGNWSRYEQVRADDISAEQGHPTRFLVRVRVTFVQDGHETAGWYELTVEFAEGRLLIVQSRETG